MAQTMKPDGASPSAKHNVAGIHKVMQQEAAKFFQIKAQRKALNDEAAESRQRLRDHGIQTKVFEHHLRLRELEPEAQQEWVDQAKLVMDALPIGTQLDMLDTVGEDQPQDVAAARKAAQVAGAAAATAGQASSDNPHKPSDPLQGVWQAGWMDVTRKRAEKMRPKNAPAEKPAKAKRKRVARKPTASAAGPAEAVGLSPLSTASKAGRAAAKAGEPITANPHGADSEAHAYWDASWKSFAKQHPGRRAAPTNPEPQPPAA